MKNSAYPWALLMSLLVLEVAAAAPPVLEGYNDYGTFRAKLQAIAKSDHVTYRPLARTLGKRDVALLTIGTGPVDEKPALLIVGGVDPARPVDSEVVLRIARQLAEAAEADEAVRGLLDRTTFYFIALAAPDGRESLFEKPHRERSLNRRPIDDDNDGQTDEDGPDDLNGDGFITMMRVKDAKGQHILHPRDDRVLIEADPTKGELGCYRLYVEGRDDDGDGELNEDPPGGVAFDRNFPFQYPYFGRGAGPHQVSEAETRAVADFAYDHANIVLVWTIAGRDNLLEKWKPDESAEEERIKTTLLSADAPYFNRIADRYEEIQDDDGLPESSPEGGSFGDWAYFHYGRWSVQTRPWWIPEANEQDADDEEDGEDAEQEESEDDDRGAADLNALAWFEEQGTDGFVDWQPIEHPDLPEKEVEIGGFRPFVRDNPPADLLDAIAARESEFLTEVAEMLPRVEIASAKGESLGSGVWRVTVAVENRGVLPTISEMGRISRDPQRLQIELKLPEETKLLTGHPRRRIGPLAGSGGRTEVSWLVHDESGDVAELEVRAWSPMAGTATRSIPLTTKPSE